MCPETGPHRLHSEVPHIRQCAPRTIYLTPRHRASPRGHEAPSGVGRAMWAGDACCTCHIRIKQLVRAERQPLIMLLHRSHPRGAGGAEGNPDRQKLALSHRCTHARLPQSGTLTIAPRPSRTVSVQRTLKDWPNAVAPEARAHAGVVGGSICKLHLRALLGCVRLRHPPSRPPRRARPIRQTPSWQAQQTVSF